MINYGCQNIDQADVDSVLEALRSDFLTQGPIVQKFEKKICDYTGGKHAVAVNSATSALHIACLAIGLGCNDRVWTSPNTFVASANVARFCGANIDFVDIDSRTFNICSQKLEQKLIKAAIKNELPKILIVVHFAGQSCDMLAIRALAKRYNFFIIEDASHALGGIYNGDMVGSCRLSDVTIFSFHPVKIITSAEGGMAITNSELLAHKMKLFSSHGVTRNSDFYENKSLGPWYYEQLELGYNYRMTEIAAALGCSQTSKIEGFVNKRNVIAKTYDLEFKKTGLILPLVKRGSRSSFHLYVVKLPENTTKSKHRNFIEKLIERGVGATVHYMPVYLQPYYRNLGFKEGFCPEAESYAKSAISLPIHPGLSKQDQEHVISSTIELLEKL